MTEENVTVETPETQEAAVPEQAEGNPSNEGLVDAPQNTEQDDGQPKQERKEPESRYDKRIKQLTWQARQAERELAELKQRLAEQDNTRAQQAAPQKPKSDDYDSNDEYLEALADWKLEQRLAEKEKKQSEETRKAQEADKMAAGRKAWESKEELFAASNPDYDDVVTEFSEIIMRNPTQNTAAITREILQHENGPEIIYKLAKDLDLAAQLYSLPAGFAARKLNEITTGNPPVKPKQPLPEPPAPVRNNAQGVAKPLGKRSPRELVDWLNS